MTLSFLATLPNAVGPAPDPWTTQIQELYTNLVDTLPPGAFRLIFVMVALTLIVAVWIVFTQRKLAMNQVKPAELIAQHLAEHEAHEAEHARDDAEHGKA